MTPANNHSPLIVSMTHDTRVGRPEGGWGLYLTPDRLPYMASDLPTGPRYLIPVRTSMQEAFLAVADTANATTSILRQLENAIIGESADESANAEQDAPLEEDILSLVPSRDRIWGVGPEAVGLCNHAGIPYLVFGDICLVFDTPSYRSAIKKLSPHSCTSIEGSLADTDNNPTFNLRQAETTIVFHYCDETVVKTHDKAIHVTPSRIIESDPNA
ncbi:hypothetical protein [Ruficoccus sp. ZRK36]|uniref:hypothetical protein n=1 Tax=Ruficoccus sp. ZRK36 TaxID=2866311 RepID=UPI001C73ACCF|nr:hypothetical protein [Ruficoccus sp. ZRK36]QYY34797.1 hypothetical protein K0V07_10850 [Ruficoccus sp. ZRK36]QYY37291.1 hypothetical protein K0V07_07350 [Ruficoccus sp. ZRK36]